MTEIRTLQPHDPLPDGPAVILMRRFEEDAPAQMMVELIVIQANQTEHTSRLLSEDGLPMPHDQALQRARDEAKRTGLHHLYEVDRTDGNREREIIAHAGDRSVDMAAPDDEDLEDGVTGSDMRDNAMKSAPRKF